MPGRVACGGVRGGRCWLAGRGGVRGSCHCVHVAAAVGRFAPRLVPRPWRASGADTLWQPDGMQMELRKGAYLSFNISPPSTPAVCHAPSTPPPLGPQQLMRRAWPFPPTSSATRLHEDVSLSSHLQYLSSNYSEDTHHLIIYLYKLCRGLENIN